MFKHTIINGMPALEDEQGVFPSTTIVCPMCNGTGQHLQESLRGIAYTQEDWHDDPDFFNDMADGAFDVECSECKGLRISAAPKNPPYITKDEIIRLENNELEAQEQSDYERLQKAESGEY